MLHVSMIIARERATGAVVALALAGSIAGGANSAEIGALQAAFVSPEAEGLELRSRFSDVVVFIDGHIRSSYEFPDPAALERDETARLLLIAERELSLADSAVGQASAAAANLETVIADRAVADARVKELRAKLGIATEEVPESGTGEPKLKDLTIAELRALAAERGVDVSAAKKKQDFVDALNLAATPPG